MDCSTPGLPVLYQLLEFAKLMCNESFFILSDIFKIQIGKYIRIVWCQGMGVSNSRLRNEVGILGLLEKRETLYF